MTKDDQLEGLVRCAGEVERSGLAGEMPLALVRVRRMWWWGAGVIAAVLAIGAVGVLGIGALNSGGRQSAATLAAARGGPSEAQSVLLAVYQDAEGHVACVNWSAKDFGGRPVDQLSSDELARAGLALSCDPGAARLLVVGLYGPRGMLPDTDERARAVAACFSQSGSCGPQRFDPQVCASTGCLDTRVQVRIASLALR